MNPSLPNASQDFKTLNPHVFGQHQAEEGVQPNVERSEHHPECNCALCSVREKWKYDSKTEREFGLILEAMKQRGEILRYEYKGMTLRWFDMKYTPDFVVFCSELWEIDEATQKTKQISRFGSIKMIEVKGPHIHYRQQAIARFKGARGFWPEFSFEMHQKQKDGWKRIY